MKKLIIISCLFLAACGSGGGGGSKSKKASKDFFSQWTAVDNSIEFDFRGGEFNTLYTDFLIGDGESVCSCSIHAIGNQTAGNIYLSACTELTSNGYDCSGELENGGNPFPYTKSGKTLTVCLAPNTGCLDYN